jgi:glycerol-3-phosphate cytidylyltransferase
MRTITLGTFDILHIGHLRLFRICRELAGSDQVVVALNSDAFIKAFKGEFPIMDYQERADAIIATGLVDVVVPNDQWRVGSSSLSTIISTGAKLIVIGTDWLRKDYLKQLGIKIEDLEKNGICLCYEPRIGDISTTEIKKRICSQ